MTNNGSPRPRRFLITTVVLAAIAVFAITALLINIFERKQEAKNPFYRVVELNDTIDDPAVWGKNFPMQYDLYLCPKKCEFEQDEIEYLRLVVSKGQVSMNPGKVKAVVDWPTPRNLKDVRGFVGFANFYCHFIKDFSKICRPLHDLTKKDVPFNWDPDQATAFEMLKHAFMLKPVLAM